ncbi:MAG TPA: tetratricopeptide repeat protein, partial [Pyrinomonadaceae bacterium]
GRRRLLITKVMCVLLLLLATAKAQEADTISSSDVSRAIAQLRSSSDRKSYAQAFELSRSLIKVGRFNEAAALLDVLVEKQPEEFSVVYLAALATFNSGRAERAESLARRAVELASAAGDPSGSASSGNTADALVLMAVVLAVRNNDAEALKAAERAVSLAPKNFDAQFVFGRALFGSGDYAGAARTFQLAVALKPGDADAQFFLATALERSGDDASALLAYRQLARESPQRIEGHLGAGVLLVKKGGTSLDEGMRELRVVLGINPKVYEARITLGRVLVSTGRPADAIEHLKIAADLVPNNPEPHYQLSIAYRRLGRKEEAAAESAIVKRIHESRRGGAKSKSPPSANYLIDK